MGTKFLILFLLGVLTSPTSYALLEEDELEGRTLTKQRYEEAIPTKERP